MSSASYPLARVLATSSNKQSASTPHAIMIKHRIKTVMTRETNHWANSHMIMLLVVAIPSICFDIHIVASSGAIVHTKISSHFDELHRPVSIPRHGHMQKQTDEHAISPNAFGNTIGSKHVAHYSTTHTTQRSHAQFITTACDA